MGDKCRFGWLIFNVTRIWFNAICEFRWSLAEKACAYSSGGSTIQSFSKLIGAISAGSGTWRKPVSNSYAALGLKRRHIKKLTLERHRKYGVRKQFSSSLVT